MRKLQEDGIFTSDEAGLLEEDSGYDSLKDGLEEDLIPKMDFSDEEEEDQF